MDPVFEKLANPLSAESPAGVSLGDDPLLLAFDAFHVFGNLVPPKKENEPNWPAVRDLSLAALEKTRDLRPLAHLAAATIHIDGFIPFTEVLQVAGRWFESFPEALYPEIDEDAIARKSALDCLADHVAIIEAIRTRPFVSRPGFGSFSLSDLDPASGTTNAADQSGAATGQASTEMQLAAALHSEDAGAIAALCGALMAGIASLQQIETSMQAASGVQAVPDFKPLRKALSRIQLLLQAEIDSRTAAGASESASSTGGTSSESGATAVHAIGSIRSREDAVRALDAVAGFFRRNEPSSPVPLFVERAKRLVSKDFLQVLADIAPEGLEQARKVGGVSDESN